MHRAKILPLARPHLAARRRAAGRGIREQRYDDGVGVLDEEARELVEPDVAAGVRGWESEGRGVGGGEGDGVVG